MRKLCSNAHLTILRSVPIIAHLICRQISRIRVEAISQPAQCSCANLLQIRLIYIIILDVLQDVLEDAQLSARIIGRLLRSRGKKASDNSIERDEG